MADTSGTATRWWWVRHAPVPDHGRIYGQSDLDCDCSATEVFAALAKVLPDGAVWLTSQLGRTRQTAAAILGAIVAASERQEARRIEPLAIPAFAEQHLGDWQGMEREAFRSSRPSAHDHWLAAAHERPPNGESFQDLTDRVWPEIMAATERHRGRDIVAVTHGGTIRAALGLALGLDAEASLAFEISNCSITCLDHLGGDPRRRWRVRCANHRPWTGEPFVGATGSPA